MMNSFPASLRPKKTEAMGTQAKGAMKRRNRSDGSSRTFPNLVSPAKDPTRMPAVDPMAHPRTTRRRLTSTSVRNALEASKCPSVAKTAAGGGNLTAGGLSPMTTSSQMPTTMAKPTTAVTTCARRLARRRSCEAIAVGLVGRVIWCRRWSRAWGYRRVRVRPDTGVRLRTTCEMLDSADVHRPRWRMRYFGTVYVAIWRT